MIKCIRYHVFSFDGEQYRAKIIGERLVRVCTRLNANHAWRAISRVQASLLWIAYRSEKESAA